MLTVNGAELIADPSGALYWPAENLLAVADLHFEKGTGLAAAGAGLLPPYDTRTTLQRLGDAIRRLSPAQVICLGDSFHDAHAEHRLGATETALIRALTEGRDWIWITGNHDPEPPRALGGRAEATHTIGGLTFRHEPLAGPRPGEVAGHLHPKASIRRRGRRITRRCFVSNGLRLLLPAFGAYAGGLDVLDPAFQPLFGSGFHAWLLGRDEVYPVQSGRLVPI